ncbi:hypothetical protein SAMN05421734_103185 [Pelagirhabdus alkalitolerans]|uniref:Uncharacterized protein n=1 Tax=Pelagirhabdus alkalitolerans TaxID=1612202 RepID=A0A1G6HRC8_9BACI|nr:hypothetical protein [Pelagirhabdus alkalitolerans]SDB96761.1 hypothetical protein SAMN05421734_103185 [Pelagirhabdus alkalitolerans]
MNDIAFYLSILVIFIIDFHMMTLENKINIKEMTLSVEKKNAVVDQFNNAWLLIGPVVMLFALYFQLSEGNHTLVITFSLFYIFLFLRKYKSKGKFALIQLCGTVFVYTLSVNNSPEILKGILLIAALFLLYQIKKSIFEKEKLLDLVD